ncbi:MULTISPECIES: type II toxin-antitoxin system Phd/YefM family antitoxin [Catenibacterium]|jgi:PHD/YefM family antitoxin component YafN of YafNO toxin-antitoxin module|uniref:Type II toxin-antitoxin system Phd/YefM family antitoxin n=1 Tax=Catenibacterium mitsuokai TaxID=100886 RepID=A0AAW4MZE6_9FIRM|nr:MULTISPECIES: type II toxin-antitoxin system Phd/YefM family antitoxin [Catenibacterium]MBD9122658.1 type II toxin-antitoxin system Phd/YefM family antitoxin [Catenibacterium mitsuokai]MBD9189309.1 type II toxin-antitoxin system Phd/YefM family antitoxin [Catenibacterium mitsuokai]MBU9057513.1 type II toxin-antitoxin system Phd/YefM family antitoxin [Catenibacterium mitsuokai]MBV3366080.1 type II toxin-antitoxin system Phd/YefM family antitoxin [Catenibacterium mitsuokai]MBV3370215.1 type I
MQIIPMRDLKNTVEVERRCAEENGPVFVTKNGYGRLVVMDIDYYEKTMRKMDEATTILDGLKDVKSGNTVEGDTAISNIRSKYGI